MPLGALVSGLMNSAGAAVSAAQNYKYSKKLQEHQYNLNRKALREQYANTRYSLESAGYNPLLAVGSSAQGFSAGASASGGDLSSLGSDMVNSAIQAKQSKAQIDNTYANSALVREQAETEKAKRTQMEFQNAMTDVETHLKRKDLSNYDKRFYSEMYELMQRAENYKATSAINAMNAETNRINARTNKYNAETSANRSRYQNARDEHESKYGNPFKFGGYAFERQLRRFGRR